MSAPGSVIALDAALMAWIEFLEPSTPSVLALATPNPGWSVADVVNHVVAVTRKFTAFADGTTDRPRTPPGDLLGTDHLAALRDAADRARTAWHDADPDRICHLPFGSFPAAIAAGINLFDLLGHGWDVEMATGTAFRCPDAVWAAGLAAARQVIGPERDARHYAPELPAPPGASARIRLLRYLGRPA